MFSSSSSLFSSPLLACSLLFPHAGAAGPAPAPGFHATVAARPNSGASAVRRSVTRLLSVGSGSSSGPPPSSGAPLISSSSSSSSAGHAVVLVLAHVTGAALGEAMGGPSPYPAAALAPVPVQPGFGLLQVGGCQLWAPGLGWLRGPVGAGACGAASPLSLSSCVWVCRARQSPVPRVRLQLGRRAELHPCSATIAFSLLCSSSILDRSFPLFSSRV